MEKIKNYKENEIKNLAESCMHEIAALTSMLECGILDPSHVAEYEEMRKNIKENFVKAIYQKEKFYIEDRRRRKNGEVYVIYKTRAIDTGKYICSNTYEGLVNKLYAYYSGDKAPETLEEIFGPATLWKAQRGVSGKTMYEYKRTWVSRIADDPIAKMKVTDIDAVDLMDFYERICIKYKMTWGQVTDVRNVISYLMKYCISKRLIKFNPANDVDYSEIPCVKTASRRGRIAKTPFTPEQTMQLIKWCDDELEKPGINPLHPLGIKFTIRMADRYGELRGLKWSDIDFANETITVEDQHTAQYEMNDDLTFDYVGRQSTGHIKGYEAPVALPMPKDVIQTLKAIKALNLDDKYVFPANNFRYNTFNDKVKEGAAAIGLSPAKYSTHSLRATAATNLYLKTHDLYQVQMLLHHTTPAMTMRYINDLEISARLRQSLMWDEA